MTEKENFFTFHSDPSSLQEKDLVKLNEWMIQYPYCQNLYLFAARSAFNTSGYPAYLEKAATLISSRAILYDFIHYPENFIVRTTSKENLSAVEEEEQICIDESLNSEEEKSDHRLAIDLNEAFGSENTMQSLTEIPAKEELQQGFVSEIPTENNEETQIQTEPVADKSTLIKAFYISCLIGSDVIFVEPNLEKEAETAEETAAVPEEIEQNHSEKRTYYMGCLIGSDITFQEETNLEEEDIHMDDLSETSEKSEIQPDEIGEETQNNKTEEELSKIADPVVAETEEEMTEEAELIAEREPEENNVEEQVQEPHAVETAHPTPYRKAHEELLFESPAQSDFFAFQKSEHEHEKKRIETEATKPVEEQQISPYNDDRMPYTFLWWLNKTRKEHAVNHQPYAAFKLDTTKEIRKNQPDNLDHQIAEHIFHLRGAEDLAQTPSKDFTFPFDFRSKELNIIEKFIKEEPQIKPPAAHKIDTENKAKKSSEDANNLISETLAKIYVEQMLYHKALEVYKKLSLKFPEKSTYFASQIKYLELKVN